ncbi:MAG: SBBP repeat-containing protein, partial [Melioribacteraceae bacterium]
MKFSVASIFVLTFISIFNTNIKSQQILQKNYFIENKGQWPKEVKFLTQIGGMNAWLTETGIIYDYYILEENNDSVKSSFQSKFDRQEFERKNTNIKGHIVKEMFDNLNFAPQFITENEKEGYYNYFIGNDKSKWVSNVKLYENATLKNIYNGIDVKYYFDNGFLRYDYIVKPGADLSQLQIKIDGVEKYSISKEGEFEIETSIGIVKHKDILAYQYNENGEKEIIDTRFETKINGTIGLKSNNYDDEKELIIDPLIFSTFLGGSLNEESNSIAIDSDKNSFITGSTVSTNFPTTSGAYETNYKGGYSDIFVTKLNSNGSALVYSTFLGGSLSELNESSSENVFAIKLDSDNNAYIAGLTTSSDFPTTLGAF